MHTTAEKTTRHTSTVQRQSGGLFFARKHDAFFGGEKTSSTSASFIQPKLSVSQPDDPQEKEADHMAHKVMTMPDPVAVAPAAEKPEEVQRAVEEKEPVQRAAENKEEVQRVGEQKEEVQRAAEEEVQKMEAPKEEVRRVAQRKEEKDEVQRSAEEEVQRAEKQEEPVQRSAEINIPRKEEQVQRMCSDCKQEKETVHRQEQKEEVQTKSFDTASSDNHQHFSLSRKEQDESDKKVSRKPLTTHRLPVVMRSGRGPPTTSGNTFEQNLDSTKGIGAPMSRDTLGFMESRFQADFSGVRIHTGETAVQMSQSIHAQAFTHGNDIYFNNGKYSPQTSEGQHLLAHELTHTIQQGASYHTTPSPGKSSGGGNAISAKRIFPKRIIQRSASNLAAAVSFAKGEAGKVIANKDGGDGMRTGWPRLMEYFKTTLGAEKIIPDGQAGDSSTVPESSIKKKKDIDGVAVIMPDGKPGVGKRDIMPSWCGIFAFWSLNKAGLPMKKWELG
ncbi:MAG TPA: DUF4157 domain-containing protein, partial [Ohtaekwangia sp.]|uniref:eCIS core domain-containing protein n=1 Tax=Ohtaekwangia sp. TaxID=2066019 RepID=UPI002F92A220